MDKGLETWKEIKKLLENALINGEASYVGGGNKSAGTRARKALDEISKLKVQWRREVLMK